MARFSRENTFSRVAIGRRVRHVRGSLASQAFAARLGVSPGFINEIEHGRKKPSAEMLFALEAEFGVDATWVLRGGDGPQHARETAPRYGTNLPFQPQGGAPIPVYRQAPERGGLTADPVELRLPSEFAGRNLIAVILSDDSMAPTAALGAVAGIDRRRTRIVDGDLALVELKGTGSAMIMLRRVYRTGRGIRLRAEDNRLPEDLVPLRRLRVIGTVVWVLQSIRSQPGTTVPRPVAKSTRRRS
jgi:transcriptional regulator with XRE-family HTH domain